VDLPYLGFPAVGIDIGATHDKLRYIIRAYVDGLKNHNVAIAPGFLHILSMLKMLPLIAAFSSLFAVAIAHSTHHSEQQVFSQEHLQELERKWGTDVGFTWFGMSTLLTLIVSGAFPVSLPLHICHTYAA
jgi:hypothetical protein